MSSDNKELIHLTGIEQTKTWFEQAIPEPTVADACVQIGCHMEEVGEMLEVTGDNGALAEVNRSNFSKFEDGKPVFDANGKITKGKNYTPPDLTPYI